VGREQGLSEAQLRALGAHATSDLFDPASKASLAYADAMTLKTMVSDEIFERLRLHFSDNEIVALTAALAWEICASTFNRALDIEGQGICLVTKPVK